MESCLFACIHGARCPTFLLRMAMLGHLQERRVALVSGMLRRCAWLLALPIAGAGASCASGSSAAFELPRLLPGAHARLYAGPHARVSELLGAWNSFGGENPGPAANGLMSASCPLTAKSGCDIFITVDERIGHSGGFKEGVFA